MPYHVSGSCTDTKTLFALGIFGLFFPDGVFTTFSLGVRHISSGEDKMIVSAQVLVIAIDIRLSAFAEDCHQQLRDGHEAPSALCLPCSGKRYDAISFHVIAKAFAVVAPSF